MKKKKKKYIILISQIAHLRQIHEGHTPFPFCGSAPLYRFGQRSCPIRLA